MTCVVMQAGGFKSYWRNFRVNYKDADFNTKTVFESYFKSNI